MTGSGTQADPYILTTANDLYAISSVGSTSTYCRLGCDIDFNGTPYAENFTPITLYCRELDGNGFCIRNIYVNKPSQAVKVFVLPTYNVNTRLKNLRLENIELIGSSISLIYTNYYNEISMHNCTFIINLRRTGTTADQGLLASDNISFTSTLSTVAVRGWYNKQFAILRSGALNRSHFHLELEISEGDTSDGSQSSFLTNCTVTDSYITGEISSASQLTGSTNMSFGCSFNNSYTAMRYVRQNDVFWNGTMSTPCFYDKELAGNRDFTDGRTYYGLTTAQCKDADYLTSIGFIVAGEE